MERYRLIFKHEFVTDGVIKDIDEPIECCVAISSLQDSMDLTDKFLIYEMCENIIKYLDLEEEGELDED